MWVAGTDPPPSASHPFCHRLNRVPDDASLDAFVEALHETRLSPDGSSGHYEHRQDDRVDHAQGDVGHRGAGQVHDVPLSVPGRAAERSDIDSATPAPS